MKRELRKEDFQAIKAAVLKAGTIAPSLGKAAMSKYKPGEHEDLFTGFILGCDFDKFIVDETYLLFTSKTFHWFDPTRIVLDVILVLKIANGPGTFHSLNEEIEKIAAEQECNEIIAGTFFAADDSKLAAAYQAEGFQVCEINLIKKLKE